MARARQEAEARSGPAQPQKSEKPKTAFDKNVETVKIGQSGSKGEQSSSSSLPILLAVAAVGGVVGLMMMKSNDAPKKSTGGTVKLTQDEHKEYKATQQRLIASELPEWEGDHLRIPRRRLKDDKSFIVKNHVGLDMNAIEIEELFNYNYEEDYKLISKKHVDAPSLKQLKDGVKAQHARIVECDHGYGGRQDWAYDNLKATACGGQPFRNFHQVYDKEQLTYDVIDKFIDQYDLPMGGPF